MGNAEIIAELARLSPEDLDDVRAWLDRFAPDGAAAQARGPATAATRIRTPRLADPARAGDFTKRVTDLPADVAS